MYYTFLRYACCINMFTKVRLLILFLLIGFVSNAQSSYTYTAESFEENIWGNAAGSFNTMKTVTGEWIVAKNNIQTNTTLQTCVYSPPFNTLHSRPKPSCADEIPRFTDYARQYGLANAVHVIVNSNEFLHLD